MVVNFCSTKGLESSYRAKRELYIANPGAFRSKTNVQLFMGFEEALFFFKTPFWKKGISEQKILSNILKICHASAIGNQKEY